MLRFLTAGESHGKGLVAILEGIPKGLKITEDEIAAQLARRQAGYGRGLRQKIEKDRAQILSGVRLGYTLGSPIGIYIENKDYKNWKDKMPVEAVEHPLPKPVLEPRPGHVDLAGLFKYEARDVREMLERASARETAARVAIGSIARKLLKEFQIEVYSWVISIGDIQTDPELLNPPSWEKADAFFRELFQKAESSPVRCPDKEVEKTMIQKITETKEKKDTLGGIFQVVVTGLPPGLGSFMHWDRKLDGRLAQALMSIPAVKGVEIGLGFAAAKRHGTEVHDPIFFDEERKFYRRQNNAGGLEGGTTNGMPLVLQGAMKPISTTMKGLPSVNIETKEPTISLKERSDVCAVPACAVVAESVVALVLADAFLEKFGGDTIEQTRRSFNQYREALSRF